MTEINFDVLTDASRWQTFDAHIAKIDAELDADLRSRVEEEVVLRREVRKCLEREYDIRTADDAALTRAEALLFQTKVCAVDGTWSHFPMLSGLRCRIGVAATTYRDKRTEAVLYVSEQHLQSPEDDPLELLKQRRPEGQMLTPMVARAVMLYKERQVALGRSEEWALVNGPLVPYELRTGLGKLRALRPCLDIAGSFIEKKQVVGVLGHTVHLERASAGLALEPGEYVRICDLAADLEEYMGQAKFSDSDSRVMRQFIGDYGTQIVQGIYRAGARPYVFEAHEAFFDEAAALLIADSSFQPLRGYPLLIDYADSICKHMLSASDFQRQVQFKLAKLGSLAHEAPEELLRRR